MPRRAWGLASIVNLHKHVHYWVWEWKCTTLHIFAKTKSISVPLVLFSFHEEIFAVSICAWFLKCQFGSLLQTRKKKLISNQTWFFFEFELDFYCLCSLQKSISKSNWFFNFLNLIFRNWKKNWVTLDISKIKWR